MEEERLQILDCTLRDGAYVVDGEFGAVNINKILTLLSESNVDIVECGWLKDTQPKNGSVYFSSMNDLLSCMPKKKGKSLYSVMFDFGRYNPEKLSEYDGKAADIIRIVTPKSEIKEALETVEIIKNKGYEVYFQPTNISGYSKEEIISLCSCANKTNISSISIVDTFGSLYLEELEPIFAVFDRVLNPGIKIGFHSHNNLQLSFALSCKFIELAKNTHREYFVDSSIFGMGRGAGNTCTEVLADYLNKKYSKKYDISKLLQIYDECIKDFTKTFKWGYSVPHFISGRCSAHCNNVKYLEDNYSFNSQEVLEIIEAIDYDKKSIYDYEALEQICNKIKTKTNVDT